MEEFIFDIEADDIYATRIHCLCYCSTKDYVVHSITDLQEMREFFRQDSILIGHNIIRYDIPTLERLLDLSIRQLKIDTLALSWYLETNRKVHGLEEWGEFFGIAKPPIDDWKNQPVEVYVHRCSEDVRINSKLWQRQLRYLHRLYGENPNALRRLYMYLEFKLECVRDQEQMGLKLDIESCKESLAKLEAIKQERLVELIKVMPKVAIKKKKKYSNVAVDAGGNMTRPGELFFTAAPTEDVVIETVIGFKDPNPNSYIQVKNWLYSLGWVPEHIKHQRDKKTGEVKEIPQIASKEAAREGTGEICPSIKKLYKREPNLVLLEGLSVASHRISIFKGFLKDQRDGRIYASMAGLTNTLRLMHKTIVNLPAITKKYGEEVRKCLVADEGSVLCGSDLSNIEDRTKRHYIYKYDPAYVEEMNVPGYDAHLELGILAGFLKEEDQEFYKKFEKDKETLKEAFKPTDEEKARFKSIKAIRNKSKVANFSATYKIGAPALSRNSGMKQKEATRLLEIYWQRNEAILKVEESLKIKTLGDQKWLFNPVSKYWYSLRADKDKFSTLNQGTAVYVFDIWITYLRKLGLKIPMQYHDEILMNVLLGKKEEVEGIIKEAMRLTNEKLQLNVEVGCGTQWGPNYAEVH